MATTKPTTKVQLTFLLDLAAALPNRDQNGRAKRVPYGDAVRQRISSQCYKAAMRGAAYLVRTGDDGEIVPDNLSDLAGDLGLGMAVRSRHVLNRLLAPKLAGTLGEEASAAWTEAARTLFLKAENEPAGGGEPEAEAEPKKGAKANGAGGRAKDEVGFLKQPVVIGDIEVAALAETIGILAAAGMQPKALRAAVQDVASGKRLKAIEGVPADQLPKAVEAVENLVLVSGGRPNTHANNAGIDGAFFGRFSTADFLGNVDAAIHVGHLIGVNPIQATPDYFSVQDTIIGEEERGAAHQNTTELASSLFLGTIVIDTDALGRNTGNSDNANAIAECVAWCVRAAHTVNPSAKLGSTAPYGNIVEAIVEVGPRQPRSHIIAFQKSVKPEAIRDRSLAEESAELLRTQVETSGRRFGAQRHVMRLTDFEGAGDLPAYEELAVATKRAVLAELAR